MINAYVYYLRHQKLKVCGGGGGVNTALPAVSYLLDRK